jgi:hypothetical protein
MGIWDTLNSIETFYLLDTDHKSIKIDILILIVFAYFPSFQAQAHMKLRFIN